MATFHPPATSASATWAFTFFPPDLCYSAANKAVQQVCQLRFSASCPTQAAGKSARILISISLAAPEGRWRASHFYFRHSLNK